MLTDIRKVVDQFKRDWEKFPYLWGNEIDVQVELAGRLKNLLKRRRKDKLIAKYSDLKKTETFNRLCCEPPIYFEEVGGRRKCYPDIVIFANNPNKENDPPDNKDKVNWPMIWVCEIKYQTEWGGDFHKKNRDLDRKRLNLLLTQSDGAGATTFIDIKRWTKKPNKITVEHIEIFERLSKTEGHNELPRV